MFPEIQDINPIMCKLLYHELGGGYRILGYTYSYLSCIHFILVHIHGFAIKPGDILHVYEDISGYQMIKDGERSVPS